MRSVKLLIVAIFLSIFTSWTIVPAIAGGGSSRMKNPDDIYQVVGRFFKEYKDFEPLDCIQVKLTTNEGESLSIDDTQYYRYKTDKNSKEIIEYYGLESPDDNRDNEDKSAPVTKITLKSGFYILHRHINYVDVIGTPTGSETAEWERERPYASHFLSKNNRKC